MKKTYKRCNLCGHVNHTIVRKCRKCNERPVFTPLNAIENVEEAAKRQAESDRREALLRELLGED